MEQLARLSEDLKNNAAEQQKSSQAEVPDVTKTASNQPLTAPKRGQSEYVEFVEPMHSNKLRGVETMEKRVPAVNGGAHGLNAMAGSSNVAFVGRCIPGIPPVGVGKVKGPACNPRLAHVASNANKTRDRKKSS